MDIQEDLRNQVNAQVVERLGVDLGLTRSQTQLVAGEVLPHQLDVLTQRFQTPAGAQRLLDSAQQDLLTGSVHELTTPVGIGRLQRAGTTLLPEVMGATLPAEVQRIAALSGVPDEGVRRLMERLLPLLLGLIVHRASERGLTTATLHTLFGAGVAGAGLAAAGTTLSSTPDVIVERGATAPATPAPVRPAPLPPKKRRRRGLAWLWLIPLALLLALLPLFLRRGQAAALAVTSPADQASVRGPVQVQGTGRTGETVTVSENGAALTRVPVGPDGHFSATLPAPSVGAHRYTISETGTTATVSRAVTRVAVATATPHASAARTGTSGASPAAAPTADSVAFTAPTDGSSVAADQLTLQGRGPAQAEVDLSEDGTSLGHVRTDDTGSWSFVVPSPPAGAHTYTAAAGATSSALTLTVTAGAAQVGVCAKPFSLSLKGDQRVKAPFRFGGVGSGKAYEVTVSRGSRTVGRKTLTLGAGCSWSYTSRPGQGRITYTLRESGERAVVGRVTLDVIR